jgi:hypothetical protein
MIQRDFKSYKYVLYTCILVLILTILSTLWFWGLSDNHVGRIGSYVQIIMFLTVAITLLINIISFKNSIEDRNRQSSIQYANMSQNSIGEIHRIFMSNNSLNRLYYEMWNYIPHLKNTDTQTITEDIIKNEHLMSDFIFQKISEIFFTEELYNYAYDSSEWLVLFYKWLKSPILQYYWQFIKNEYHESFQLFIDKIIIINKKI